MHLSACKLVSRRAHLRLCEVADDCAREVQRVGGRRGLRRRGGDLAHQPQDMHQQLLHVERAAVVRLCSASATAQHQ